MTLPHNHGLGVALNVGLARARADVVAYLPADDIFAPDHLARLLRCLDDRDAVLAIAGVVHHGGRQTAGPVPDGGLQLVQVAHRRTDDRWVERSEVECDDLDMLFWRRLRRRGRFVPTGSITCTWREHAHQRHKLMRESHDGGLNVFRQHYQVGQPLRFRSRDGGDVDEVALYRRFRRPPTDSSDGLRVLLVGELAFNPERIVALEERGHELRGLWIDDPLANSTVGPLPFGNVRDVPRRNWQAAVRAWRPDVVYGLLNWRAVPLVRDVLDADLGIPLVWHFKEAPQRSRRRGSWRDLVRLHERADQVVYATAAERDWFEQQLPDARPDEATHVMDGDLPKREWLDGRPSGRWSATRGDVHTVVLGRPIGFDARRLATLAAGGVHVHFHGLVRGRGPTGGWVDWLHDAYEVAPGRVHVHPPIDQRGWVRTLSRYDAAWLHPVASRNGGDLRRASWDDLNQPARVATALAAGLPLLQQASPGCRVAMQDLVRDTGAGLLFRDDEDLIAQLRDGLGLEAARRQAWAVREQFTFDAHVDRLERIFRQARV